MAKMSKELKAIKADIAAIQERIKNLKKEGIAVDVKLQAALDQCKKDVTALAAQNSAVDVQPIIDAVNAIDQIAQASLTGNNTPSSGAPSVTSLTPSTGTQGANVAIKGSGFGATQGSSTVTFNGTAATPNVWGDAEIDVPVPPGATSGPVVVTVNGTASNGSTFTVQ